MLKNTFLHIPGIGIKTERLIWNSGILDWDEFTEESHIRLSSKKLGTITGYLRESKQQIELENPNYFSNLLPANLHWRLFPEFRNSAAYLDIETTGLESWENEIPGRNNKVITLIFLIDFKNMISSLVKLN